MQFVHLIIDTITKLIVWVESLIALVIPHKLIVLDTETTGLSSGVDDILELSIIDRFGHILFNHYIRPVKVKTWPDAQKVNHIAPWRVAFCPSMDAYAPLIKNILKRTKTVVGYNTSFDLGFLEAAGIPYSGEIIDVMREDAARRPDGRWRKLNACAISYGYVFSPHDSLEDSEATLFIYKRLHPENILTRLISLLVFLIPVILFFLSCYMCELPQTFFDSTGLQQNAALLPLLAAGMIFILYGPARSLIVSVILALSVFSEPSIIVVLIYAVCGLIAGALIRYNRICRFLLLRIVYIAAILFFIPHLGIVFAEKVLSIPINFTAMNPIIILVLVPIYMFLGRIIRRLL